MKSSWRKEKIDDLVICYLDFRGKTPLKLGMDWGGGDIRALSANNVEKGKINFEKECYFASEALYRKWMNKGDCEKGDVLLTMEAPLGNVAQVPDDKRYILSQRTILLKFNKNKVDNDFMFQLLLSEEFQKKLMKHSTGSTVTGIQQKKLSKLEVSYPCYLKQQKIAKILSTCDEVIEKTEATITKYQSLKQGMMHDLFTRGIDVKTGKLRPRFEDAPELYKESELGMIPREWEVKGLGDLGDFKNGINKDKESFGTGTPFVNIGDAYPEILNTSSLGKVEVTNLERAIYKLEIGDIIFVRSSVKPSGVGYSTLFQGDARTIIYCGFMIRFRMEDKENHNPFFYNNYFRYSSFRRALLSVSTVSANTNVNQENLKRLLCVKPMISEQLRINSKVVSVSNKIQTEQSTLSKYQQLKAGLMQDLLTGKVEVSVEDEAIK